MFSTLYFTSSSFFVSNETFTWSQFSSTFYTTGYGLFSTHCCQLVIALLSLREFLQKLCLLWCHKIAKRTVANGTESNRLNRIFVNERNYRIKMRGTSLLPQVVFIYLIEPISSSISLLILHADFLWSSKLSLLFRIPSGDSNAQIVQWMRLCPLEPRAIDWSCCFFYLKTSGVKSTRKV